MLLRPWTLRTAGAALLALGGVTAAHSSETSSASTQSPPAPPAPPAAPTSPEAPYIDRAEIDREVDHGMAEARAGIAEARKEIAEARAEIMREKDMPRAARAQALAALDKAERDVANALARGRD